MAEIMPVDNINALNAVTLPISNGIVPSTPAKLANKQHLGTHPEHAMDVFMMTEFAATMILKANMMATLQENVNLHRLFVLIYFSKKKKKKKNSKSRMVLPFLSSFSSYIKQTIRNVSSSRFSFQSCYLSFNQQALSTCDPHQKSYMVSQKCGLVHMPRPYFIWRTPIQLQPIPIVPRDNPLWRAE
jgi:hypothetical protein